MKYVVLLLFILILSNSAGYAQSQPASENPERSYVLHMPETDDQTTEIPALIALHATASSGLALQALTGLDQVADENGFMVVYPNSQGLSWGEDYTDSDAVDDVGYLATLVDELVEQHRADRDAIYLTGIGGGGLMAYRAACERHDLFKGLIVVSTLMWGHHREHCPDETSSTVNFLLIHGSADHFYTQETHLFETVLNASDPPLILGVEDTLAFWAERNGCDDTAATESENVTQYVDCNGEASVALYNVRGGGHSWPRIGDYQLNQYGVDASQLIGRFISEMEDWAIPQTAPFDDQPRSYTLYIPASYDPDQPTPLMVGLHGRFSNGASHAYLTDTNLFAEEHGFIALYPDGLSYGPPGDYGWNYSRGVGPFLEQGVDDTAFILALIDDITLDLNIDRQRIYVNGMSNGGFMVHRLACEVPSMFAGFASVAGSGFEGLQTLCAETEYIPVPMLIIHGTLDNNVLWDGRTETVGNQQFFTSVPIVQMLGFWSQYNQCDEDIDTRILPQEGQSPDTEVRIVSVQGCQEGSGVELYAIINGGHNWPGSPGRLSDAVAGLVNEDIHATEVIWDVLSQFTREPAPE